MSGTKRDSTKRRFLPLKDKALFICNIANVAYGYSKIMNQAGFDINLICHDMKHLMSQPEWDDMELNPDDFPDENDFYKNTAEFGEYQRPDWYCSEELLTWQNSLIRTIAPILKGGTPIHLRPKIRGLYYVLQEFYRRVREKITRYNCFPLVEGSPKNRVSSDKVEFFTTGQKNRRLSHDEIIMNCRKLAIESLKYGPEFKLSLNDFLPYILHVQWLQSHIARRDTLMACVLSPIYCMIYGELPYVSIEIGTMREIPFDGSGTGKLLALAYRLSDSVLITNPDVRNQAESLGLKNYRFCPHPLDEDVYHPANGKSELREKIEAEWNADFILLAPARQNWFYKRNDRIVRAFWRLRKAGIKSVLVVPTWGQDIKKSKDLGASLGLEPHIKWIKPLSEPLLVKYIQAADVVLDQFSLGVFGLLSPKAMSCGRPVLSSYRPEVHDWCFSSPPPLVRCLEEEEIFDALFRLAGSKKEREEIGRASREWVLRHHSKIRIKETLLTAIEEARLTFDRRKNSEEKLWNRATA